MKFEIMKQGYNRYEVDVYVEKLENEVETLNTKLRLYKTQLDEITLKKEQLQEKYNELAFSLQVKEKASEELSKMALKEANQVIEAAQKNSEFIIQEAFLSARLILIEVSKLGGATNELKEQIKERVEKLNYLISEFKDLPTVDEKLLK